MIRHVDDLIRTIQTEGTLLTHEDTHADLRVSEYFCSAFIPEKNLLVKGEYDNPHSESRKAVLVFLDPTSNKVKGRASKRKTLTPRPRSHFTP